VLPRIANFDDLDALAAEPDVDLVLLRPGAALPVCDLAILPGSKATIADLAALRAAGWDGDLLAHRRRGGRILGLCGGYQMLGESIADPDGIEGPPGAAAGLGLLAVATVLGGDKRVSAATGVDADGVGFTGYEIHLGTTTATGNGEVTPLLRLADGRADGAATPDGLVCGCYVHGLFVDDAQRAAWLRRLGGTPSPHRHAAAVEATLDALAAHLERHMDVPRLLALAR
jgi:adenosylcobyric acid synthase